MKRGHYKDQVDLAGALTRLRSPNDERSVNKHGSFTGSSVEKRHATWAAWSKYLDDYCYSNNVRIGTEFTDSVQKRNEEMRKSKRAKAGKFVRFLPEELEAYRRSYVCRLGRKGRTRDVKFRRTACPFKLVAKSVYDEGKWEVEVLCSNAEHIHSGTTETGVPAADETEIYIDVIVRFVKLMRRKPLLLRLASSETTHFKVYDLHKKLDDVAQGLKLDCEDEIADRCDQLAEERQEQYAMFKLSISNASDRMLINEFRGDQKLHVALMSVTSSMKWKNQSPEMLALKKATLDRVVNILPGLTTINWFITMEDVEYEDSIIKLGTFGETKRGSWLHYGERTDVVVKHLFKEIDSYSSDMFRKQLEFWCTLDDKHILKCFGGSYIDRPQFYVCENAEGGNLRDFFAKKENRGQFWRMFRQAGEGLQVLHAQKHPHGALKCSNILVGADNIVKLSDFGFHSVRSLATCLSGDADEAIANSIRWKPKELLKKDVQGELLYKADVYALGMCMIEALAQKDPFPNVDNTQVVDVIRDGTAHDRPDDISEAEWAFICRLCTPNNTKRPNLDVVLCEIIKFAEGEELRHHHKPSW
ncbi:Serine/threonine protein kinase [Phytophthora megakarya]|uniref:Serine/threonine protein kinase n=1 Tax=Phytophthora megakarya TaxID=4795 RepID=A0A225WQ95_9STRA|nr:Serine/threonine protein kinase [Phytophthora megakarya]